MTLPLSPLTALSPLDGRYEKKTASLRGYFSEFALIKHRVHIEIEWLIALSTEQAISECADFSSHTITSMREAISQFSLFDAERIKAIEATTNHDVKAVEYWLREKFSTNPEIMRVQSFIHFACTSEDINNLSYGLMLKAAREMVILPILKNIQARLQTLAHEHAGLAMLSRTHGQPASPTTMGKEMANFAYRMMCAYEGIANVELMGKINGAVGNYNAHFAAYPNCDWPALAKKFVEGLGLAFNPYTIQIEPHDYMAQLFDSLARFNTILIDLNRDMWSYISLGYFKQQVRVEEVGSSTMPHKVNPIDFENSEGNLGIANALLRHMAEKLPVSRWQRDLTDSTVLRNVGVALGHCLLAYDSLLCGLNKLEANPARLAEDLDTAWDILTEPIQTIMRKHGISDAYEQLKILTRGKDGLTKELMRDFVKILPIPDPDKTILLEMTPATYTGQATRLAEAIQSAR